MVAGLSFLVGCGSDDPPPPPPPPPQPTKTVVKVKEVERRVEVPKPFVPSQCKDAVALARELNDLVVKYETAFAKENSILSDAHTAIVDRDIKELNDASQRQIHVKSETIGILLDIREKGNSLDKSLKQCDAQMTR